MRGVLQQIITLKALKSCPPLKIRAQFVQLSAVSGSGSIQHPDKVQEPNIHSELHGRFHNLPKTGNKHSLVRSNTCFKALPTISGHELVKEVAVKKPDNVKKDCAA
nr:hypothetical protein BaRGS_013617 [Batillaria attramentaria]